MNECGHSIKESPKLLRNTLSRTDAFIHHRREFSGLIHPVPFNLSEMYFTMPKLLVLLFVVALQSSTCSAQAFNIFGPLFSGVTSFTMVTSTSTLTKPTPCFITSGHNVTVCRRKRGIEEKQEIIQFDEDADEEEFAPSVVMW